MKTIAINGVENAVSSALNGFEFRVTPESSYVEITGVNWSTFELFIKFKKGYQGLYKNIPSELLSAAMATDSMGKFVNSFLRNTHKCEMIKEVLFKPVEASIK